MAQRDFAVLTPNHNPQTALIKPARGMTLVELMIGITVLGAMMLIAAPTFTDLVTNTELRTTTNDFVLALRTARSEAIKRRTAVRLESLRTNTDWSGGWQVSIADTGEQVAVHEGLSRRNTLQSGALAAFQFDEQGFLTRPDTLRLCNRGGEGRAIIVLATGQTKVDRHVTCA